MFKRLLLSSFFLILSGCITTDITTSLNPTAEQQWQFSGKFAIRTPDDKNSAKLHWSQVDEQYDINIFTVFGISVMSIIGNDNKVTIDQRGTLYEGQDAQQLIYQLTRWHIPVNELQRWVTGTVNNANNIKFNDAGHFQQGDITSYNDKIWQLTLSQYREVDGHVRPHKLLLKSDDSYFKLAISQWKIQK